MGVKRELESSLPFFLLLSCCEATCRLIRLLTRLFCCSLRLSFQAAARINDPNLAAAERARLKALEESRDAALAGDLFGAESLRPIDASSDLPGSGSASASAASAAAASSPAPAAAPLANDPMKGSMTLSSVALETDADVDRFVSELSKRLEKMGKSVLASKRIARLIMGVTDESAKLGVLRLDDVGELKRQMTVRHTELTNKMKKGDKKGANKQAAKPAPTLARNAFMHGDIDTYHASAADNTDDFDFI